MNNIPIFVHISSKVRESANVDFPNEGRRELKWSLAHLLINNYKKINVKTTKAGGRSVL